MLGRDLSRWTHFSSNNNSPRGVVPPLNVSVKLSALYSQIHPAAPDTAIDAIATRLRPILRKAQELNAFINFDIESYALKDLTLRLFKSVFAEEEFSTTPACGLAIQAYLKESAEDLVYLASWGRTHHRRFT